MKAKGERWEMEKDAKMKTEKGVFENVPNNFLSTNFVI